MRPSSQAFAVGTGKIEVGCNPGRRDRSQGPGNCCPISFTERNVKPLIREIAGRGGILQELVNRLMQRMGVRAPFEVDECASDLRIKIVRSLCKGAVKGGGHRAELAKFLVARSNLLEKE